jgi:hypothetical protein
MQDNQLSGTLDVLQGLPLGDLYVHMRLPHTQKKLFHDSLILAHHQNIKNGTLSIIWSVVDSVT